MRLASGKRLHAGARPSMPEVVDQGGLAPVWRALFALPQDSLTSRPTRWRCSWRPSRGPLDLLLYLIRKQNFNILDIPMVDVTRQCTGYVDGAQPQSGAGGGIPAHGGHAHRDQVAHAAAPRSGRRAQPTRITRAPSWYAACWNTSR